MPKTKVYRAADITTKTVDRAIRSYNARVTALSKRNKAFSTLPKITRGQVVSGRTEGQIARELNFLNKLASREQQKIVTVNGTKMPAFARSMWNRYEKQASKIADSYLQNRRRTDTFTVYDERPQDIKPPEIKTAKGTRDLKFGLRTLIRRSSPTYFEDRTKMLRKNWERGLLNSVGEENAREIIDKFKSLSDEQFLDIFQSDEYGPYMENAFYYLPEERDTRAQQILDVAEEVLENAV